MDIEKLLLKAESCLFLTFECTFLTVCFRQSFISKYKSVIINMFYQFESFLIISIVK
jgi:hypothetical protein